MYRGFIPGLATATPALAPVYSISCPNTTSENIYIYIFNELSKIDPFVRVFEEERRGNIINQRGQHTEILKLGRESSIIISPPLSGLLQPHFGSVSFTLAWWHVTWPILDRGLVSALLAQSLAVVAWVRVGADIQKTQFSELFTQKGNLKESYPTSLGMCITARNGAMVCGHHGHSLTECPPLVHSQWQP